VIPTSDDQAYLGYRGVQIDRLRGAINIWPGGNFGIAGSYAWTRGRGEELISASFLPTALPYLPESYAQLSLSWTSPARIKLEVLESYSADQLDFQHNLFPTSFLTSVAANWEPFDKRIKATISIDNLFGTNRTPRYSIGRVITTSLAVRF
jgi:hypothetical protein